MRIKQDQKHCQLINQLFHYSLIIWSNWSFKREARVWSDDVVTYLFVLFWAAIDSNNLSCSLKLESILGWIIRGENVLLLLHSGGVFDVWGLVNSTLKSSSRRSVSGLTVSLSIQVLRLNTGDVASISCTRQNICENSLAKLHLILILDLPGICLVAGFPSCL